MTRSRDCRTFMHRSKDFVEPQEFYLTVHETYYKDGVPYSFEQNPASPSLKEDCATLAMAFDKPPVGWIDDDLDGGREPTPFEEDRHWGWMPESGILPLSEYGS